MDRLRYSRAIIVVPFLLGIALKFLTGRTFWFGIGVVWFLGLIAIETGAETFLSVRHKLPRRKRDALVEFLSTGGYTVAAASMAAYFAFDFWSSYRPRWLVTFMFVGVAMFFSSGFVYKRRSRKKMPKHEEN